MDNPTAQAHDPLPQHTHTSLRFSASGDKLGLFNENPRLYPWVDDAHSIARGGPHLEGLSELVRVGPAFPSCGNWGPVEQLVRVLMHGGVGDSPCADGAGGGGGVEAAGLAERGARSRPSWFQKFNCNTRRSLS